MSAIQNLKIVTLSTSCWRATRLHKSETSRVNDINHTKAARVTVKICDHSALTEIRALHATLYTIHVKLTRPSIQDGMRIIPLGHELEHMESVRQTRTAHDSLVSQFLADYDNERAQAQYRLNGLYDPSMWPDSHEISRKFGIECRYLGCPDDPSWREWLEESSKAATTDLCDEIESTIEHIANRCEGDGKLHASIFQNLRNLLKEIPEYDCGLDSRLINLATMADDIARCDVRSVRESDMSRLATANDARRVLDMFAVGSLAE